MTILLFFVALAILILSHELGHFLAAKKSGVKVEEFGLGFPPRIFKKKKGDTVYSVNAIPFGGFVKIFGEDSTGSEPGSFASKPIYIRAVILAAGVFFNLVLAWVLFSLVFAVGAPTSVGDEVADAKVTVMEVRSSSPAEKSGLIAGDQLTRFSFGQETLEVKTPAEAQDFVSRYKGREIKIEIVRGKEPLIIYAIPDLNPSEGKGALGIAMDKVGLVSYPVHLAIWEGLKVTVFLTGAIVQGLIGIITDLIKGVSVSAQVAGPVGIVKLVGTASEFGFVYVLQLFAILSINLAIINFVPFPALDGGRLLFLAIEALKGSPISQKIANAANTIGFAILIGLMILITYRDVIRLFG